MLNPSQSNLFFSMWNKWKNVLFKPQLNIYFFLTYNYIHSMEYYFHFLEKVECTRSAKNTLEEIILKSS